MTKYSIELVQGWVRIFHSEEFDEIVKFSRELCNRDIPHYIVDNEFAIKCPMAGAKNLKS